VLGGTKMRLIHEAYWKIFKNDSFRKQRNFRALPLNEIAKHQWVRLKKVLDIAYSCTDFYKTYFDSVKLAPSDIKSPSDLLKLPITDKKTYQNNFNDIVNKNAEKMNFIPSCTSGSTGEPLKFFNDIKEGPNLFAAFLLNKESMGVKPFEKYNTLEIKHKPRNELINFPKDLRLKTKTRLFSFFHPKIIGLNIAHIKPENTASILKIFRELNIQAISGYSSSILDIAQFFHNKNISLNLQYINTIGETCLPQQKSFISEVFNCPVYRDYSSSECLHMGSECKISDGYHMDAYNYFFEFLKDGRPAKENEHGDIVVTNLNNRVFPFIRYKIGDTAILAEHQCGCGNNFPLVKNIHGRNNDSIKTLAGREMSGINIPLQFDSMYDYIKQYQLIQVSDQVLLVKIVPTELMNKNKVFEISELLYSALDRSIKINIELVKDILPCNSGKKKLIITKNEFQSFIAAT
jgi:phenylacetate-CoA ligase